MSDSRSMSDLEPFLCCYLRYVVYNTVTPPLFYNNRHSQGSTKIFKTRPGQRLASVQEDRSLAPFLDAPKITSQDMNFVVTATSALFLLPEPVTCFRCASYNQKQTFHLSQDASLVILDWITSGRKSLGEEWVFSRYYSVNEVWVEGKKIAKDVMLLDDDEIDVKQLPRRILSDRLAPYSCYATVILYGPLIQPAIRDLATQYESISVFKTAVPAELIWSLSPISSGATNGAVVRVAGKETESVKHWLGNALKRLELVVGIDVYRKAFT